MSQDENGMNKFRFEAVKEHIGSIVHVDKADIYDEDFVAACREILEERTVLVFPKISFSEEEHLAFTERFGKRTQFTGSVPGGEAEGQDFYRITLDKELNDEPDYVHATWFWHMDGATMDQPLPKASFLAARRVPERGGQTQYCSLYAAYEMLPEAEKEAIENLRVIHRIEASMKPVVRDLTPELFARYRTIGTTMVHPLVWTHPSGRKSLILGSHADEIIGMPYAEGHALLIRLLEWSVQPDFTYSHQWQVGDMLMWNNCGALHRVIPYSVNSGRLMQRTTIYGEESVAIYRESENILTS